MLHLRINHKKNFGKFVDVLSWDCDSEMVMARAIALYAYRTGRHNNRLLYRVRFPAELDPQEYSEAELLERFALHYNHESHEAVAVEAVPETSNQPDYATAQSRDRLISPLSPQAPHYYTGYGGGHRAAGCTGAICKLA